MSMSILSTGVQAAEQDAIIVETRSRSRIKNCQLKEISSFERATAQDLLKKYRPLTVRTGLTPLYNCHGMTFASRRTCITECGDIQKILNEDGYSQISINDLLPGDVILYFGEKGEVEHSGVVVSVSDLGIKMPIVCSKWGKSHEVIHSANNSPYNFSNAKYFRVSS